MSTDYTLGHGTHATPQDGRCAMEWVSYLAGEPHGDEPVCVSPVLRALCIALNDGLGDQPRQRLRPYLARTIGTSNDGLDGARSWMAMDWLIRDYTTAWLRLARLTAASERLASLPPVLDVADLGPALSALRLARRDARAASGSTLGMRWPAVGLLAGSAGESATREAAWGSVGAAAWAAARLGVGDIAADRARAIARAAAAEAAASVVRQSFVGSPARERRVGALARHRRLWIGGGVSRDPGSAALESTRSMLLDSILALLDRMLPTETLVICDSDTAGRVADYVGGL